MMRTYWHKLLTAAVAGAVLANGALGADTAKRVPTLAELAGYQAGPAAAPNAVALAPVQQALLDLRAADNPTQREMAAITLTLSAASHSPEVVAALMRAGSDSAPACAACVVRCLYHLSGDMPAVVPVLEKLQHDANEEVRLTARLALEQMSKAKK